MTCPNCNSIIDDRSNYCNHCGRAQHVFDQTPPPGSYACQPPTGDQNPQPPVFNSTGEGGVAFNGKNNYLFLAVGCCGWALLVGLPKVIGFLAAFLGPLVRGDWSFSFWPSFSGFFSVAFHLALPLAGAAVFWGMHQRNNA